MAAPITLQLWYEALAQEHGLVIAIEGDREKARQKLYRLRSAAPDPDLEGLSVVFSPTDATQLWIVKK